MNQAVRSVAVITILLMVSAAPLLSASGSDAAEEQGIYGTYSSLTYEDIDKFVESMTEKSIEQWIETLNSLSDNYQFTLYPGLESEIAVERMTATNDNICTITDRVSLYANVLFYMAINGHFPEEGIYCSQEGESMMDMLIRVFTTEGSPEERWVDFHILMGVYVQIELITNVDLDTGEITDVGISAKLAIMDNSGEGMRIDKLSQDDDSVQMVSITYGDFQSTGNFYLDFEASISVEGLKVINDEALMWDLSTRFVVHMDSLVVSSDLANSMWGRIKGLVGDIDISKKIPDLVLSIIGSGSRMVDVFETIKSLTGKDVQDMTFTADVVAYYYIDDKGNLYTTLEFVSGSDVLKMYIPLAGYSLDASRILSVVPSYILSDGQKVAIIIALTAIGWNDLEVNDISEDKETKDHCDGIIQYVDDAIIYDEEFEFAVPYEYGIMAGIGIVLSLLTLILMRRRMI